MTGLVFFLLAQLSLIFPLLLLLRGRANSWPLWYLALTCLDYFLLLAGSYDIRSILLLRLTAGTTLLLLLPRRRSPLQLNGLFLLPRSFPSGKFLSGAVLVLLAMGAFWNALTPPSSWDAMTYHLEWPLQWLEGRVRNETAFGDLSPPFYPALPQLFFGTALASTAFTVVDSLPLLLWLFLFWGLRGIALCQGQKSGLILLIFALSPLFFSATLVAEADLLLTVLFTLALWNFLLYKKTRHSFYLLHAVLATGLMAATKYSGLLYGCALLFWAFAVLRVPPRVWPLIPGSVCGMFFYLRNLIWTGNPLYPAHLPLLHWSGLYDLNFYKAHTFHTFHFYDFFTDPHYAPLLFLTLFLSALSLRSQKQQLIFKGFILILLLFLTFYFLIPLRQLRQLMPLSIALYYTTTLASPASRGTERFLTLILFLQFLLALLRLTELYGPLFEPSINLTEFSRQTFKLLYLDPLAVLPALLLFLFFNLLLHLGGQRLFLSLWLFFVSLAWSLQSFAFYRDDRTYFYNRLNQENGVMIGVLGLNAVAALRGERYQNRYVFLQEQAALEDFTKVDYILSKSPWTNPYPGFFQKMEEKDGIELWKRIQFPEP